MSAQPRLPEGMDERADIITDVLEGLLARWDDGTRDPGSTGDAVRNASHAVTRFREQGLDTDRPTDPLDLAIAQLGRAIEIGPSWIDEDRDTLQEVVDEVTSLRNDAIDRVALQPIAMPAPRSKRAAFDIFQASVGVPALRRGVEIPPPATLPEELRIEVALALTKHPPPVSGLMTTAAAEALAELEAAAAAFADKRLPEPAPDPEGLAQLQEIARSLMEDTGSMVGLRRPLEDETWVGPEKFEARLLAQLDALFSLARRATPEAPVLPLVQELYNYATEWAVPDAARAATLALPLACIEGESAARWLLGALARAHERVLEAFGDALALGPNTVIPRAIAARLVASQSPRVLATLLDAARRRTDVDPTPITLLLAHPDPAVASRAALALTRAEKALAVPLLTDALSGPPEVAVAVVEALASFGVMSSVETMRGWLIEDLRLENPDAAPARRAWRALRLLASHGAPEDEALVVEAATRLEHGLAWLGTFGSANVAPMLIDRATDPTHSYEARRGLDRMFGTDLVIHDQDLTTDPFLRGSFDAALDDARKKALALGGRIRRGARHAGIPSVLHCLGDRRARARERASLALELGLLTGSPCPFDLGDWLPRQRAGLDELRARYLKR